MPSDSHLISRLKFGPATVDHCTVIEPPVSEEHTRREAGSQSQGTPQRVGPAA
jgi:hypothetical protein